MINPSKRTMVPACELPDIRCCVLENSVENRLRLVPLVCLRKPTCTAPVMNASEAIDQIVAIPSAIVFLRITAS
jgi:hypothetical protein